MVKADIINIIFEKMGLSKQESKKFLEKTLTTIKEVLKKEGIIKISGFGTFKIRQKNTRIGRNPKTKEEVQILPRKVIKFKPSRQLNAPAKSKNVE